MEEKKLRVSLLGGCAISYGEKTLDLENLRSKKIWQLLGFLVTFRFREISQDELLSIAYAEDASTNPANALKTLIHRVRAALDELGGGLSGKTLILQRGGSYCWNNSIETEADIEGFDRLYASAQTEKDEDRKLDILLKATRLYKGDYMPKFSLEPWAIPINTYYHSRYLQLVDEALSMLSARSEYDDIVDLCYSAITIEPFSDTLYYNLIDSLVKLGQLQAAMIQYEKTTKLFYREFGVTPPEKLQALYKEILSSTQGVETDITQVQKKLSQDEGRGAFVCEYEIFKDIYNVEVRAAGRTGRPMHICLITARPLEGRTLSNMAMNEAMQKLISSVKASLRKGDCLARYSVTQLVLLLPLNTNETVERVLHRVTKNYKADYPRSPLSLDYSFQPVEAVIK